MRVKCFALEHNADVFTGHGSNSRPSGPKSDAQTIEPPRLPLNENDWILEYEMWDGYGK